MIRQRLTAPIRKIVHALGYSLVRTNIPLEQRFPDVRGEDLATWEAVRNHTMTSPERLFALCEAVRYIECCGIPGDIVECGVWRGGSMMAAARTLLELGQPRRTLWLYDTFEGMSRPTGCDMDLSGNRASDLLDKSDKDALIWCYCGLEEVRPAVLSTGYPEERTTFVRGPVEQTLPAQAPEEIALLRLDTDWYESTRHELEHLYPRLVAGGILIIDDYGHWKGARKAVDEYLLKNSIHLFLNRIDYTGRVALKPRPISGQGSHMTETA